MTGLTGTVDQVLVNGLVGSKQRGDCILTLPQSINTTSTPEFKGLTTSADILPKTTGLYSIGNNSYQYNNLYSTNIYGTLQTASQPNITTLAGLTSMNGITVGAKTLSNITTLTATNLIGTLATAAQSNITSVGTLNALRVSGQIFGGNGSLSAPSYAFTNATSTGMYLSASNTVSLVSNGIAGLSVDPTTGVVTCAYGLNVLGAVTSITSTNFVVGDNIGVLAMNNPSDLIDVGVGFGYITGGNQRYGVFYRGYGSDVWYLKDGVTACGTRITDGYAANLSLAAIQLTTGAANNYVLKSDASGNASWAALSSLGVSSITGTTDQVIASASTGAVTLSLPQSINTTSIPTFQGLNLAKVNSADLYIGDSNEVNGVIKVTQDSKINYIESGTSKTGGSAAPLYFTSMQAGSTWMIISSTGRVGINTTSPYAYLDVIANGSYTNTETSTSNGISISSGRTTSDYTIYMGADKTNTSTYIQSVCYGTSVANLRLNARGGDVIIGASTTTNGLILSNNTTFYTAAKLNYYEETSFSTTFYNNSGASTSSSIIITLTRVGRVVTIYIPIFNVTFASIGSGGSNDYITTSGSPVPVRFIPPNGTMLIAAVVSANVGSAGIVWLTTAGNIRVYSNAGYGVFLANTTNNGFINAGFSASYNV